MGRILLELRHSLYLETPKVPVEGIKRPFLQRNNLEPDRLREKHIYEGYISLFAHTGHLLIEHDVDILITENTVSREKFPQKFLDAIPSKLRVHYNIGEYNRYGQYNKGAGNHEQWRRVRELHKNYDWIISHEPKQKVISSLFFSNFLNNKRNLFGWATPKKVDFNTGTFAVERELLWRYIDSMDIEKMINGCVSLEKSWMDFVNSSGRPYEIPEKMDTIRYTPEGKAIER